MAQDNGSKPLMHWLAGAVIVAAVEVYLAFLFFGQACAAPALAQIMVLIALPAVYLVLMYLTLKRQP